MLDRPSWAVISAPSQPIYTSDLIEGERGGSFLQLSFSPTVLGVYEFKFSTYIDLYLNEDSVKVIVIASGDVGPDQTVPVNTPVTLTGTSPVDSSHSVWWDCTSGPAGADISGLHFIQNIATFTPAVAGTYTFSYTIGINTSVEANHFFTDTVTITVNPIAGGGNTPPTANAGPDQNATVNTLVSLNGNISSDADGNPLTYAWTVTPPSGSNITLTGATSTFTPDQVGNYVASLIVNDGMVNSAPSSVTITVAAAVPSNIAPVANAGPDQNATVGNEVTLNGNMSSDGNGNALTYSWSFISVPSIGSVGGTVSSATLAGANTKSPTFTPDMAGDYVVSLIVNDGMVNSTADTVIITAAVPAGGVTPVYVTNLKNLLTDNSFLVTHTTASSGLLEVMEFGPYGPGGSMTFTYINPSFSSQSPHVRRTGSWMVLDGSGFAQASESLLFASRVLNTGAPVSSANTLNMTGYSTYSGITDTTVASWIKVAPLTANDLTTNDLAGRTFTSFSAYYTFTADGKGTYYNGWSASAPFTWVIDSTGRKAVITFSAASTHHLFMTVRGSSGTFDREFGILDLYNGDVAGSSLKNWSF